MNKISRVQLIEGDGHVYQMGISFDHVFQIINENNVPIGLVYISEIDDKHLYIEWIEILSVFRGRSYLRRTFEKLKEQFGKIIQFECSDELLRKYIGIGCVENGIDDCTGLHMLSYM